MGFFKKIFKGIKKVFKKIGKAIKKTFKKIGKFMGKIGIVGQLGLALIMPYALPALGGFLGTAATSMMQTSVGGFLGTAIKGAGHFLNAAVKLGTRVGTAFKSVTSAVTKTIGNMVGATINSLPGGKAFGGFMKDLTNGFIDITDMNFSNAWDATQKAWGQAGADLGNLFSKSTFDSSMNKFGIQANLKESFAGADTLTAKDVGYDPVTGERSFSSLDINDPNFSMNEKLGLGREGTTYNIGNTATQVDLETMTLPTDQQISVTVGGTEPTSSLLAPQGVPDGKTLMGLSKESAEMALRPAATDPFASSTIDVGSTFSDPNFGKNAVSTEFDAFTNVTDPNVIKQMTDAKASLGTRARGALEEQGYSMTKAGAVSLASDVLSQFEQPQSEGRLPYNDPFANVDMSYLTPQPIPLSGGLATSNMMSGMGGYSDFAQIQQDILNSNFGNIYANGYYGGAAIPAGYAIAMEELA
ncbi:MAG: hypothetical protein CL833_02065 [Crocinitomicaceae bacterium]|nr:hypothetical protein [Crocinitomicaceae bacterium]